MREPKHSTTEKAMPAGLGDHVLTHPTCQDQSSRLWGSKGHPPFPLTTRSDRVALQAMRWEAASRHAGPKINRQGAGRLGGWSPILCSTSFSDASCVTARGTCRVPPSYPVYPYDNLYSYSSRRSRSACERPTRTTGTPQRLTPRASHRRLEQTWSTCRRVATQKVPHVAQFIKF